MQIEKNKSLKSFNTFGIAAKSNFFAAFESVANLNEVYQKEEFQQVKI